MESNINIIYKKLEEFITKFHLFKIVKGSFFLIAVIIFVFLLQSIIEYFNYLSVAIKTLIFYFTVISILILLLFYFIIPLLSLFKLRKRISFKQAATIISDHFPLIKDKLLNVLELGENLNGSDRTNELLIASINQRIIQLNPFPFKKAITFENVKRNLLLFSISVIVLLLVLAFNPKVFTEVSYRLINFSHYYEPDAPFKFLLVNQSLYCEKNKDFKVELKIMGDYIPDNVSISIGGNSFLMNKTKNRGKYFFIIRNVNNSLDFNFVADKFYSVNYKIIVLPAPMLQNFTIDITPPLYTNIESFSITNSGDCTIPSGSKIKWSFKTSFVDYVSFIDLKDTTLIKSKNNDFIFEKQIKYNTFYSLVFSNEYFKSNNDLKYNISVIPDEYPEITTRQVEDSLKIGAFYFMISVKDDYGFHDLNFVKRIVNSDSLKTDSIEKIPLTELNRNQDLFYYYDFNRMINLPEDSYIEYYFEVRDNDYLNAFKPSRSSIKIFKFLSREDVRKIIEEQDKLRDDALSKSKKLTNDIQKEIADFKKKELNNELSEWDKKNFLKSIADKQKELDKNVKDILEQNRKENQISNQFYEEQKNIIEKQKQIQEILDQILDNELKELLKEIEKLSEKFDPNQFEKLRDKIDFSYKNLEKKLDRSLELLKRYQVEEKVLKLSEDLKDLSEKQHLLSEENLQKKEKDEFIKKQENIKNEFKELENQLKETLEKNEDLKSPYDVKKFNDEFEKTNDKLEDLQKELPSNSKKKSQQKQDEISKDMQKMADKMEKMFNEMEMQSLEMNMADLRQIIDNLSIFSFNQEENYISTNQNLQNTPAFPKLIAKQVQIGNDFKLIEDSLNNLMTKVPQMNQLMAKEIENIVYNSEKANDLMEKRNRREALKVQRFILNSANTLALLMGELQDQLQKQMQGGSGGKSKKGKPEQAMQNLKKQQQKLKEQLEKLLDEMKKNGGKPDNEGMNDQIVKTLAEQEIFNKMLQDMQNQQGINPEIDKKLKEIKRLSDQNIDDLINKKITPELFERNQKILTRLLESEKADQEREQEKKRESKEGNKKEFIVPEELKESLKNEKNYRESLQKSNLNLKNYYKNLSNDYFRIISN